MRPMDKSEPVWVHDLITWIMAPIRHSNNMTMVRIAFYVMTCILFASNDGFCLFQSMITPTHAWSSGRSLKHWCWWLWRLVRYTTWNASSKYGEWYNVYCFYSVHWFLLTCHFRNELLRLLRIGGARLFEMFFENFIFCEKLTFWGTKQFI